MIRQALLGVFLIGALSGVVARAAEPVVSNVRLTPRIDDSGLVDIIYDVSDADSDTLCVTVRFSVDGGQSWDFPALNLSGDVGAGVLAGADRDIVWNARAIPMLPVLSDLRVKVVANDLGVDLSPHSPALVSITDFSTIDWSDPANFDRYARADFIQLMGAQIWEGGPAGDIPVIAELKARNPDLKVIGYVSVKSAQLSGASPSAAAFWQDWYTRTQPYWVHTTTGDVASDFPGNVLINILDPECRRVMIETIQEYVSNSLNQVDGVYWDYFNNAIWVHPAVEATGEPDFDGDGVGQSSDQDEQVAYRAAQVDLIGALRDSLGADFIQFFNGQRAYRDSAFASLGDGAMYELFPTLFFPDPDMAHALDPDYAYSLFNVRPWFRTRNGGPYLVLANTQQNWFIDHLGEAVQLSNGNQYRAAALMTDAYVSWNTNDMSTFSNTYAWTDNDITLGHCMGPPIFSGNIIRRNFLYGTVEIDMTSGRSPDPFDYRIRILGQLVEELRIPYHFP